MVAFNGYATFETYKNDIDDAIKRGVRFRFIFLDPRNENVFNFMASHVGEDADTLRGNAEYTRSQAEHISTLVRGDRRTYIGNIEVRWLPTPITYSAWMSDVATEGPTFQFGLYPRLASTHWPYVKGGRDAKPFAATLALDFETMWAGAKLWSVDESNDRSKPANTDSGQSTSLVSAEDLGEQIKADRLGTLARLRGKRIRVNATIDFVKDGQIQSTTGKATKETFIRFHFSPAQSLEGLKTGDAVLVEGTLEDFEPATVLLRDYPAAGEIIMRGCEIVDQSDLD